MSTSKICVGAVLTLLAALLVNVPSNGMADGEQPGARDDQVTFNPFPNVNVRLTPQSIEITAAERAAQLDLHVPQRQSTTPPSGPDSQANPRPNSPTTYVGPPVASVFQLPTGGDVVGPCVGDGWMFSGGNCVAPPTDPTVKDVPGRHNVRTNRVDARVAAQNLAKALFKDIPLPNIVVGMNPPRGIVNIATWFWVEPASYAGASIVETAPQDLPWQEWWTETVEHTSSHPCADDATKTCTDSWTSEDPFGPEEHHDFVQGAVQLTPARYVWDWGDGTAPSPPFTGPDGLGRPYTDPYTPSPVAHMYHQSSAPVFDQGGFEVTLTVNWSAAWTFQVSGDTREPSQQSGTFPEGREGVWAVRHQVRESQPVVVWAP